MTEQKILNVHIGELYVGKKGQILRAILGSCVGIGFIWEEKNICGLAHCLLPEAPNTSFNISARYVTQAIPSLIALMKIRPTDIPDIKAVVVGGGDMTGNNPENRDKLVGAINSRTALKLLHERKIKIIHQDFGGTEGRQIIINCDNFSYQVRKIPRNSIKPGV